MLLLKKILKVFLGLTVFAYGVHLTIAAGIGVAPWDCLGQGIAARTPLSYGAAMTACSLVILCADLALKQPIGFGIVIDALYTGNATQFFNDRCALSNGLTAGMSGIGAALAGCALMLAGLAFMAAGQAVYMGAGLSCGPRDSLTVGLGKRMPKVPIGLIQNGILLVVFAAGALLGGSVGIGTLLSTLATGAVMQLVFRLMRFEPRAVRHQTFAETLRGPRKERQADR